MTRYYFDIPDDTGLYPDEEGLDCGTQREAEVEAAQTLADLTRNLLPMDERRDLVVEVRTNTERVFQVALVFNNSRVIQ